MDAVCVDYIVGKIRHAHSFLMDSALMHTGIVSPIKALMADRVMLLCTAVAVSVHVLLIFGLSFVAPSGDRALMQDVTVAVTLAEKPDEHADFLAQANQTGSGVTRQAYRLTSPEPSPVQSSQIQEIALQAQQPQREQQASQAASERVLVTQLSWQHIAQSNTQQAKHEPQPQPTQQQQAAAAIASLEAQYARRKQEYSKQTSVHTVDSVSAKADPSAAYIEGFRRRVEQVGNRHYPELARAKGWSGDVRLMVIVRPDGRIRAIRLLESSGHPVLDEAARNSVRQAAPYQRFHASMREFSELRIIRTWRFSQESDALAVAQ